MDQTALLHIELLGLQSAQQILQKRIDEIQGALRGQPRPVVQTPSARKIQQQMPSPISDAKRAALAKARAALAQRRKQESGSNGQKNTAGVKGKGKAGLKRGPA